ncbi:diphosphomevalonate decarboxylase [Microbacterium indicum]|uniref:diphosphomevalonate decarboxylase n=1 Tax=Microbacterium indicum TaxID=358100 RepID=UPI000401A39A|nr:diphosphomevalonate decarboxylase [Microbacterium indicum]
MTTATAQAHPNIALVKYWGKRDEDLVLPLAGSLSMTLDALPTTTSVTLDPSAREDAFELNGEPASGERLRRVARFLDLARERAGGEPPRAIVRSRNEAPTGAGLASSASGFAALALAASAAYGLPRDARSLSRLARRGSGSAARSVVGGFAVWHAGDDETSYAEAIDGPDLRMVIVTVDGSGKAVSSREAMRRTALTSPFHDAWALSAAQSLDAMIAAFRDADVTRIGRIAESNALRMHAVIQSADPPIRYLGPASVAVFDAVRRLRGEGLDAYATADAGPNVVAICRPEDAADLARALAPLGGVRVAAPGPGATLTAGAAA